MISEWWASEAAVLAGGYLPNAEDAVSALAINQTCNSVCFMVPIGIAMAGSARVGNRLGEGDAHAAKVASVTAALLGLVSTLSVGALVAALRHSIGGAFNASEGVRELLPGVFLILACTCASSEAGSARPARPLRLSLTLHLYLPRQKVTLSLMA